MLILFTLELGGGMPTLDGAREGKYTRHIDDIWRYMWRHAFHGRALICHSFPFLIPDASPTYIGHMAGYVTGADAQMLSTL